MAKKNKWLGTSIEAFNEIQARVRASPKSDELTALLATAGLSALAHLETTYGRRSLVSTIPNKSYFSFVSDKNTSSRAVNAALFPPSPLEEKRRLIELFVDSVLAGNVKGRLTSQEVTTACYLIVMGFACVVDLINPGDKKTPGTFYEYLVRHLLSRTLDALPSERIWVQVGPKETDIATLTMDLVLDRGAGRPRYHVAIKNSTRERGSEFWAHQRILDAAFPDEQYIGIFFGLAETKLDHKSLVVTEICVPDQWRAYQAYISTIARVYYLDPPEAYVRLRDKIPPVVVTSFGDFFFDDWSDGWQVVRTSEIPGSMSGSS